MAAKKLSKKGMSEAAILDAFLEIEFLHSLGSYTNARQRCEALATRCAETEWKELVERAFHLNTVLEEERDRSDRPSRHPNPCKREGAEDDEPPYLPFFLLFDNAHYTPIAQFFGLAVEALGEIESPHFPRRGEKGEFDLEQFGKCLFWDHDPTNASWAGNVAFEGECQEIDRLRDKGASPEDFERGTVLRERIENKRARYDERRRTSISALKPKLRYRGPMGRERAETMARGLLETSLARSPSDLSPGSFPVYVVKCLVSAHLRLHYVEHLVSKPFTQAAGMDEVDRERIVQLLIEAEALNTFVFLLTRRFPWLFSADRKEAAAVLDRCVSGFGKGKPEGPEAGEKESDSTIFWSLWRSRMLGFMALHRRAFGHALKDAIEPASHNHASFNDFRKLQHLLRVQRRVLGEVGGHDARTVGALSPQVYLDGMDALAETHIGDLYRADHAHPVALEHYCDAQDRLEQLSAQLREAEVPPDGEEALCEGPECVARQLQDSRWRIHLMLSKGKGFYEVGNLKRSVKWMLKSWSALLTTVHLMQEEGPRLAKGQKPDPTTFRELEQAIQLLSKIRNDPDFRKADLQSRVEPIVKRATKIVRAGQVREDLAATAAEILLRLGHVLFVLQLGEQRRDEDKRDGGRWIPPELDERDGLAFRCLQLATELDEHSTLVAADRLKIQYKQAAGTEIEQDFEPEGGREWLFGRGSSEQVIRKVEYLLLRWLVKSEPQVTADLGGASLEVGALVPREADRLAARRLIADLLTHTDSINVRQSQVYRYLMQPRQRGHGAGSSAGSTAGVESRPASMGELAIEFVCLRRYSSFFPFVPRPSAFRSVGGGYLLRLHHQDKACPQPFGVAVDPGPDFIENLYRCGFGLGDIDMIVVTHDHSDHSADLYPILSLLGYRMKHGDRTFSAPPREPDGEPARRMLIVGNQSVARQLSFFNKPHATEQGASDPRRLRPDAVQILSFDEFDAFRDEMSRVRDKGGHPEVAIPEELRLRPVVSLRHRDAFGMLAYGFRISLGDDGPSVGFTGDTGGFRLAAEKPSGDGAAGSGPVEWRTEPHDREGIVELTGNSTWRDHWSDVLDSDVLVGHVSGLPLPQLQALASHGVDPLADDALMAGFEAVWSGLEDSVKNEVGFAFWLRKERDQLPARPLAPIEPGYRWPESHLYLVGLLEFAREYRSKRRRIGKKGLFLVGELREELGSLRSKIATRIDRHIFETNREAEEREPEPGCSALTADVGLRLLVTRDGNEPRINVLCTTCDLDNDRTLNERFHDSQRVREVCVKGENEGIFYNCFNHDPSHHREPVFLERIERYDVFSTNALHH